MEAIDLYRIFFYAQKTGSGKNIAIKIFHLIGDTGSPPAWASSAHVLWTRLLATPLTPPKYLDSYHYFRDAQKCGMHRYRYDYDEKKCDIKVLHHVFCQNYVTFVDNTSRAPRSAHVLWITV